MDRRTFLSRAAIAGVGSVFFPWRSLLVSDARADLPVADPHFFIHVMMDGGVDSSYLYDARPLSMTAAGLIQNYRSRAEEPRLVRGLNGTECLRSPITDVFHQKHSRDITVLNGVVMSESFDGHGENVNQLFSGNAFGGEYFLPHLNAIPGQETRPVGCVQIGPMLLASLRNRSDVVPLAPSSATNLTRRLREAAPPSPQNPVLQFALSRMDLIAGGQGAFAHSASRMAAGLRAAPELATMLRDTRLTPGAPPPPLEFDPKSFELVTSLFSAGVTRTAYVQLAGIQASFDAHGVDDAKKQPELIGKFLAHLDGLMDHLKATEFSAGKSFLDVTTVLVSSEFGRTMRQKNRAIDATGTDHNPLNNSLIIAGKGIRKGLVIGQSDFRVADETLSGAHLSRETGTPIRTVGRPFDFSTALPISALPETFEVSQYLTIGSVVNTIYDSFGVPAGRLRTQGRNGVLVPLLRGLQA